MDDNKIREILKGWLEEYAFDPDGFNQIELIDGIMKLVRTGEE